MSKGCFAFKGKTSTKSGKAKDELNVFTDEPWYKTHCKVMKKLEDQLKNIDSAVSENVLHDMVSFISMADRTMVYGIPAAILLTGVNLPDHGSLFKSLSTTLYENVTQHRALLNSNDCLTIRNTIEQMTARFMNNLAPGSEEIVESDSEDEGNIFSDLKRSECTLPALVSWYADIQKQSTACEKLVVIIPDFESFSPKVFQEFVLILSGYLDRLPLVLIIGVATSIMALHNSLPHSVISRLSLRLFQSQPSIYFLNSTVEKVFLTGYCPFQLGRKVFKFLTDVFLFYDFSVEGFIKGVKYCMLEHFYNSELSVLCCPPEDLEKVMQSLGEKQLEKLRMLPSFRTYVESKSKSEQVELLTSDKFFQAQVGVLMRTLRKHLVNFHVTLRLLHVLVSSLPHAPLGKQVRELYCEAAASKISENPKFSECFTLLGFLSKDELLEKMSKLLQILEQTSDETKATGLEEVATSLSALKKEVEEVGLNVDMSESPTPSSPSKINMNVKSRRAFKEQLSVMSQKEKQISPYECVRAKVLTYLREDIFSRYLMPPTLLPLHEVVVFDNVAAAKRHVVGIPRAALHTALNDPHHYLQCDCCKISDPEEILTTMPDICIAYKLHLESGALINMYDWLQSFVTIVSPNEQTDGDQQKIDPKIQARFTRAVAELQFLGFIKSSKQKTDHVTRLTWGGTS